MAEEKSRWWIAVPTAIGGLLAALAALLATPAVERLILRFAAEQPTSVTAPSSSSAERHSGATSMTQASLAPMGAAVAPASPIVGVSASVTEASTTRATGALDANLAPSLATLVANRAQTPSDTPTTAACTQLSNSAYHCEECAGAACRCVHTAWNCDADKRARVRCRAERVEIEPCARGCEVVRARDARGTDDFCTR